VPRRILVADDEAEIRKMMRTAFETKGYEVAETDNGRDVIQSVKTCRPDLVVMDIRMPSMDGWAALAQINQLPIPPPVVIVSSADDIDMNPAMLKEGVAAYLTKPFRIDELITTCQGVLGVAAAAEENRRRLRIRKPVTLDVMILGADGRPLHKGRTVDLSALGAQIALSAALAPAAHVRVSFHDLGGEGLTLGAVVRWWRRLNPANPQLISHGVSFTGMTPVDQQRIKDVLNLA
jgi:CheY-like chemotaxis protein